MNGVCYCEPLLLLLSVSLSTLDRGVALSVLVDRLVANLYRIYTKNKQTDMKGV